MANNLEINLTEFERALVGALETIAVGAERGMQDVLDEWVADAVDLAPIDKATLRRGISKEEIRHKKLSMDGGIKAIAVERSNRGKWAGKRFNYAYYLHEVAPKRNITPKTPGTELEFLDKALEKKDAEWVQHIADEISAELKRKGW